MTTSSWEDWHIFPKHNASILGRPSLHISRFRPTGWTRTSSLMDIWSSRLGAGVDEGLDREFYAAGRDHDGVGQFLLQDFGNMTFIQRACIREGTRSSLGTQRQHQNFLPACAHDLPVSVTNVRRGPELSVGGELGNRPRGRIFVAASAYAIDRLVKRPASELRGNCRVLRV